MARWTSSASRKVSSLAISLSFLLPHRENSSLGRIHLTKPPLDVIATVPSLEYLHMTRLILAELPADISSSFISTLDIELSHDTRTITSGIEVIGSMPNLTHLVIRIAETIRIQTIQYYSLHDFPELPMLKTVTIGMHTTVAFTPSVIASRPCCRAHPVL